ncbi:MAG: ATP-binding protein [Methanobrevibacter sp.]|jgi:hypothetical protein|nr:ATP-binding protein [Candidatus Methanovirga procula]
MKAKLPLDESDFKKLISSNKIYIDKTKIIKRMMDLNGTYHFLSRPRRFGKSLLISTLKELFEGNKELFKDTYIYNNWNWNETYKVINLDLNNLRATTPENFEKSLRRYIDSIAKDSFNIELDEGFSNEKLRELITAVYNVNKKDVVVLIDEYDKPILDNIDDKKLAVDIQRTLKDFYGILKSGRSKLKFVFVTGITKFSKVSIFSEFNNVIQLTLDKDYSTICGYSQVELEKYFKEFIIEYSNSNNIGYDDVVDKIKYYYDGYSWDGENFLYNPYSVINFFKDETFKNYWFTSGTPNFLIKIFKEDFNIANVFNPLVLDEAEFDIFDIENLNQTPLLFQSGYLTIDKIEIINDEIKYTLKVPNHEVETSITKNLFSNFYTKAENNFISKRKEIYKELSEGSCDLLVKYLKKEIFNTPYQLKIRNWKYYQTLIYAALKSLGFNTDSEISMFSGRLDIAIEEEDSYYPFTDGKGHVIILEVKYTQDRKKDVDKLSLNALNQIKDKCYYEIYEGNDIIMIGLAIKEIRLKIGGSKIEMKGQMKKIDSNF